MRIPEQGIQRYPWYLRPFFWNQQRKYGQVLKPALDIPAQGFCIAPRAGLE